MSRHTPPSRTGHLLKPEYEALYAEWAADSDCSCHLSPPCDWCIHEGHPLNLENNDEAWEPEIQPLHTMLDQWR